MNEVCVLHVLGQTLKEAERLIENHRHCNLRKLLKDALEGVKVLS